MAFKQVPLGCLLGDKGYIRGPFGSALKRPELKKQGIPVYEQQHAINGERDFRFFIDENKFKELKRFCVQPDDLIISCSGTLGRVSIIKKHDPVGIISQALLILRPDTREVTSQYLLYFLSSKEGFDELVAASHGSVQVNIAPRAIVEKIKIPLPEIDEQIKITGILNALDKKIELNQRMNDTIEGIAQALFKSWFVDFDPVKAKAEGYEPEGIDDAIAALFPSSFIESPLGPIPHGWRIGDIKDLCQRVESGGTPSRKERAYWDNGIIPWLTSGEVRKKVILDTEEKITERGLAESSAKIWPPMSTVVAMYGATAGQVTLLANSVSANQACCALIPKSYTQSFVFLKAARSVEVYERQARGSAQQNLNKSIVSELKTIIPPQKILEAFENVVSSLIVLIIQGAKENMILSELRDLLLPRLISGKLRVEEISETVETLAL